MTTERNGTPPVFVNDRDDLLNMSRIGHQPDKRREKFSDNGGLKAFTAAKCGQMVHSKPEQEKKLHTSRLHKD